MSKKTHCDLTKILDLNICLKKQIKRWGKFVKWQQLLTVIDEMIISPNIMIWRFYFYFQPLPTWVRRDSKIIADFSVDRERLLNMGYSNVFQCSAGASSKRGENTNSTIMDYLKRVVPRMFQVSSILFYKLFFYLGSVVLEPGGPVAPPPIFGRSVNPILTGEGRLSPPLTTVFHLLASLNCQNNFW